MLRIFIFKVFAYIIRRALKQVVGTRLHEVPTVINEKLFLGEPLLESGGTDLVFKMIAIFQKRFLRKIRKFKKN